MGYNTHFSKITLQLLNEKGDNEDFEVQAGLKKQNELLQQLLKEDMLGQLTKVRQHDEIVLEVIYYLKIICCVCTFLI